ncbi:MAG TPA: YciI family protein [Candidatus Limnocylindria bacterium]
MPKYALIFIDPGEDASVHTSGHDSEKHADQERTYAEIFKWFDTNGSKIASGGAELHPPATAMTVRRTGATVRVTDGPFIEAKESIGGLTIFELADLDAAIALAKTWPGHAVEVRPIVEH